ncbi:MAG: DUF488 family protein [Solirubrobacteraceae bacterium]
MSILQAASVRVLVDVRTVPRSGRHPQFGGPVLAETLAAEGIEYRHERALGGFRRPRPGSGNTGWRQPAFQGYADHMADPDFDQALERLESVARERPTSIMCAEAQWWRCHRRLIADALTVRGWRVLHLGLGGEPAEHELTPFAVVESDGSLSYPPAQGKLEVGDPSVG